MQLFLDDVLPEGIEVEVRLDQEDPAVRDLDVKGPITGSFHIRKVGLQLLVRGRVAGDVRLRCARCLEDFILEVQEDVDIELRPVDDLARSELEMELGADDLDVEFFRGDVLDLGHLAAEQIVLAIPMKPICRETCAGICPMCGADRSRQPCGCQNEEPDNRWSELLRLKERMKTGKD